jgi:NADPH:quinone reductase
LRSGSAQPHPKIDPFQAKQTGETNMKAIVRQQYGGPEQLKIQEVPQPQAREGEVVIRVRAFGLNRAEQYFRQGAWGEVHPISGIECVGVVEQDGDGELPRGRQVIGLMGGMGRSIAGSYAEYTCVPRQNVVAVDTGMPWEELAAIPESYATAWTCLHGNLALTKGQKVLIRGATSALGQAAVNIATQLGAQVFATVRNDGKLPLLKSLGVEATFAEGENLSAQVWQRVPQGVDAVLDLIGNSTVMDSLRAVRRDGRVCMAGFLGGGEPIASFQPLMHMPSGRHFSFFASAFVFGSAEYPLSEIPFGTMIKHAATGAYRAKPAHVFAFEDIQAAHRLMDANLATGKIVVSVAG